ncbi:MAG: radical SAM protein [Vulcanimicrobiota bacterium]
MAVIIMKATEQCNGSCAYCDVVRKKHEVEVMPLETLEFVFRRINEYLLESDDGKLQLVWHGGEPLLLGADYFKYALEYQHRHCEDTSSRIEHALQSNLTALTPEFIPVLKELGISYVGTSFDPEPGMRGLGADTDTTRYNSLFMNALVLLEEHDMGYGFIYVVTKKSLERPRDIFHLLTNLSLTGGLNINPVLIYGLTMRHLAITPAEYADFLGAIFPLWWENQERYPDVEPFRSLLNNIRNGDQSLSCGDSGDCVHNHLNIDPSGKASQCGRSSDWDILPYGSIKDRTLSEILHDEQRSALEKRNEILLQQECRGCRLWFLCHGGCPLDSYSAHGDFIHRTEWCISKKRFITEYFEPVTGLVAGAHRHGQQ